MTRSTPMPAGMPAGGQPMFMRGAQPVSAFAEAPGAAQKLGMLSFLLFIYLSFGRPTDYFLSFLHLPFLCSIGALVLCVITRGAERAFQTRIAVFMLGFTLWMATCVPFSVWRGGSWATLSGQWTKSLLVFFLVAGMMITINDVKRLMTTLALASATIVALSFRYKTQGSDGRSYLAGESTLSNPNDMAQLLLIGLPFWFLILISKTRNILMKGVAMVMMLLTIYTITGTGSRGALLAIAIMSLLVFWNASIQAKIAGFFLFVFLIGAAVGFTPSKLKERYRTMFGGEATNDLEQMALDSREQRIFLLKQSLRLTMTHPIFGVGPGVFQVASNNDSLGHGGGAIWRETHNSYTQVSSEMGIPGLVFYLGVLFLSFKQVNKIRKLTRGRPEFEQIYNMAYCMFLSLISYAITSFFATVGYGFYLPALAGISSVFYVAAMKEISARGGVAQEPSFGPLMAPSRIQMSTNPAWKPALQSSGNGGRPRG